MTRTLIVTGSLNIGGAEAVVMNFLRSCTQEERHKLDILIFGPTPQHYEDEALALGVTLIRSEVPGRRHPWRFAADAFSIMRAKTYGAVHCHVNLLSGIVLMVATAARIPIRIAHAHTSKDGGGIVKVIYRSAARGLVRVFSTDRVACGSDAGVYLFGARTFRKSGRVVPNAVDLARFGGDRQSSRVALRNELQIGANEIVVGSISRIVKTKNLGFLVDVADAAMRKGRPLRFIVTGDGPLRNVVQEEAERRLPSGTMIFLGQREDVSDILGALDVFAAPSLYEGLPVSLVEAQAAGVPAVVSTGVTQEALIVPGLVRFEPLEVGAWLVAIDEMANSTVMAPEIGRCMSRQGYTLSSLHDSITSLYRWDK